MKKSGVSGSGHRAALCGILAGLAVWGLAAAAGVHPLGRSLEHMALDLAYRLRPVAERPKDLLVVAVDEPSFQEIGLPWPWPRRLHAGLIDRLAAAGARLIVMDIVFAEPTLPEEDAALAKAVAGAGNVVLARAVDTVEDPAFRRRVLVEPLPPLAGAAAAVGSAVLTPDADGTVRRFAVSLDGMPTLAGAALAQLAPGRFDPTIAGLIDYPGPDRSIDTVSFAQVIDPERLLPETRIRGRTVVVGRSLAASAAPLGQADAFDTPFTPGTGRQSAGAEIHAAILATLLSGRVGREAPAPTMLLVTALLLTGAGAAFFRMRPAVTAAAAVSLAGLVVAGSLALFLARFVFVPPVLLAAGLLVTGGAGVLYRGVAEAREKRFLSRAFSRYLAPEVVKGLLARPERLELGGEEVVVTVFFSDLAGFTTIAEGLPPKAVIGLLNEYFTPMTDIIMASGGTLDKFIGDAVMAFWGAPLPDPGHAAKALAAALRMAEALAALRRDFAARGLPDIRARMGIHAGPAVVGNVGSKKRFNYTILGDTVNLASRLESLNKYYGTEILVSEDAATLAGSEFLFREIDRVRVKGKSTAVTVYELLGRGGVGGASGGPEGRRPSGTSPPGGMIPPGPPQPGDGGDSYPNWLDKYEEARRACLERDFAAAAAGFEAVLRLKPDDGPAKAFLARCRRYRESPPPEDWDGVFVPEGK